MEDAYTKSTEEVLKGFNVSENLGLSQDEVKRNRLKYGPNGNLYWFLLFLCIVK